MKITRTTDIELDLHFLEILTPEKKTSLAKLLEKTQNNINKAIKSKFFREYLIRLMTDYTDGCIPLILFTPDDTRQPEVELLINSSFDLVGIPKNLEELEHPPVREALENTAYLYSLMRYIVKRYHHPEFAPGDIKAEHTKNGKFTIYAVDDQSIGNLKGLCSHLQEMVQQLQFEVEVVHVDSDTEQIPEPDSTGNHIIIFDLFPPTFRGITRLFESLPKERRKKTLVSAPLDKTSHIYRNFRVELLNRPNIATILKQEDDQEIPFLMNLLDLEE
ncbi:hypothetical protein HQ571_06305 [Candidatus Kuenenbacteria bacterium]|nr:hypothetical protein [Candidatus Kuenenbacteria bacterium]